MNMLKNKLSHMTLKTRLTLGFLLVGLLPFAMLALIALDLTGKTINRETFNKLTSIREMKASQIEDYFATIRNQVLTLSEDPGTVHAMVNFKKTFREFRKDNGIEDTSEFKDGVTRYYRDEFNSVYRNQNAGGSADINGLIKQLDDDSLALQYHYISKNKNPLGSKHLLDRGDDRSAYSELHEEYHPALRDYLDKFGYYDIFLVDSETGDIVYSVFKELDFTTSLIDGPYAKTNFGRAFREANNAPSNSYVKLIDFEPYGPSYNAPASFIASPIFNHGKREGVLIFQMPVGRINEIMTSGEQWSDIGLGESGESYLVAKDYKMRSQSRFFIEAPDDYFKMVRELGMPDGTVDSIRGKGTTILYQEVQTPGTQAALAGKTNVEIFADYRGVNVVSAYRPLAIEDVDWAIMAEIDEAEAFIPLAQLKQFIAWVSLVGVVVVLVIAYFSSRSITKPLIAIMEKLTSSSSSVSKAATQVSASGQSLAQGASEQASALEETAASLEEISSMTQNNNQNARQANAITEDVQKLSNTGVEAMEKMSSSITAIKDATDTTAEVIKSIDDIAFQTNLLALNAAVEAARAGEAGRGFAVVAEEVRKLAQRSAEAAKDTAQKIELSKELAGNGVDVSMEMALALEKIKESAANATSLVNGISTASSEQASGIEQVNTAVSELEKVTHSNTASAEDAALASGQLLDLAEGMDTVVDDLAFLVGGRASRNQPHAQAASTSAVPAQSASQGGTVRHTSGNRIANHVKELAARSRN